VLFEDSEDFLLEGCGGIEVKTKWEGRLRPQELKSDRV
jgi:hypothetical protein